MLKIYLTIITICTLISCSTSDSQGTNNNGIILGRWQIESIIRGDFTWPLDECRINNGFLNFYSDSTILKEEASLNSESQCIRRTYNQSFTLIDSVLTTQMNYDNKLFIYNYKLVEVDQNILKLQLFRTKVTGNGENYETDLLPSEQEIATYRKID